jgi:hypothetical protein
MSHSQTGASASVKPNFLNIRIRRISAVRADVVSGNAGFDAMLPACVNPKPGDSFALEFEPNANVFIDPCIAVWRDGECVYRCPRKPDTIVPASPDPETWGDTEI